MPLAALSQPAYVPRLYHGYRRTSPLQIDTAALPLHALYNRRDGSLRFRNRTEVAAKFGLTPNSKIILVGCGLTSPSKHGGASASDAGKLSTF